MEQLAMFPEAGRSKNLLTNFLEYFPGFISQDASDVFLQKFLKVTPWKQTTQKLWDKEYFTLRLTAWFGECERFKDILPWTPELQAIRKMVEPVAGIEFNTV